MPVWLQNSSSLVKPSAASRLDSFTRIIILFVNQGEGWCTFRMLCARTSCRYCIVFPRHRQWISSVPSLTTSHYTTLCLEAGPVITPPLSEQNKQKQLSWAEGEIGRLHSEIFSLHTSGLQSTRRRHV